MIALIQERNMVKTRIIAMEMAVVNLILTIF